LRIPGHGLPAGAPGLPPGDLYVIVRTADDPRFERRGSDLSRLETVEVYDAALVISLNVPTLDGEATVKVAPGTQPDTVLRLRGKGLPRFGAGAAAISSFACRCTCLSAFPIVSGGCSSN
jgi:molecular chaperone DnaJ